MEHAQPGTAAGVQDRAAAKREAGELPDNFAERVVCHGDYQVVGAIENIRKTDGLNVRPDICRGLLRGFFVSRGKRYNTSAALVQ
jgi:hypothetical protein